MDDKNGKITGYSYSYLVLTCFCLLAIPTFAQKAEPEVIVKTSCFKSRGIKPNTEIILDSQISEGSGVVVWNNQVWTHNDSGPSRIFTIDSSNGKIIKTVNLPALKNDDWEEMTEDSKFLYLGNFGNNIGRRDHLQIYRINKQALLQNKIELDSISFEWPKTNNLKKGTTANFDCEAMVVISDTIYLFTKEWKCHRQSKIFKIPAIEGNHIAEYVATIKTRTLITGACYSPSSKRLILCGYSLLLKPRLLVFELPDSGNFRDLNKGVKIRLKRKFRQIEGITGNNGNDYYLVSEATNFFLWKNKPKLYYITISN